MAYVSAFFGYCEVLFENKICIMKMYRIIIFRFFFRRFGKFCTLRKSFIFSQKLVYRFSAVVPKKLAAFLCACIFRWFLFILLHVLPPSKLSAEVFSAYL